MSRLPTDVERPQGLHYRDDFVSEDEERALLAVVQALPFEAVVLHGQAARRTVVHFGYRYDFEARAIVPTDPLPADLAWVRERAAAFGGLAPDAVAEILVTRYPPGATIGWHRDAPMFGSTVVGVSLGAAARMRFQRRARDVRLTFDLPLPARSAYLLNGPARWSWQHSIPPVADTRYSLTFRTLRASPTARGEQQAGG